MNTWETIQAKILSLGFDACGVALPDLPAHVVAGLAEYIDSGHHGDMEWIQTRQHLRSSPKALWPDVKSIIVIGHNYAPDTNPMEKLNQPHIGNISSYALGDDYHDVMKKRLKELAGWLLTEHGSEVKLFVDTAPVMEKPLAELAGIGWQGKHTNLISREFGNWLFLGCVFVNMELQSPPSESVGDKVGTCGTCTACIDICPTQAIIAPYKLDARKCIAYLTIEHKGHIPVEYRKAMGNRIYGCDDCLAVCPWNKFAQTTAEAKYQQRDSLKERSLEELAALDDAAFRKLFSKSPVKRTGRDRFVRNVCIAMGNTGDGRYVTQLEALAKDESELVREAADWALHEMSLAR